MLGTREANLTVIKGSPRTSVSSIMVALELQAVVHAKLPWLPDLLFFYKPFRAAGPLFRPTTAS
jgi:hypothetical protein